MGSGFTKDASDPIFIYPISLDSSDPIFGNA
jgi:hypothetical protein